EPAPQPKLAAVQLLQALSPTKGTAAADAGSRGDRGNDANTTAAVAAQDEEEEEDAHDFGALATSPKKSLTVDGQRSEGSEGTLPSPAAPQRTGDTASGHLATVAVNKADPASSHGLSLEVEDENEAADLLSNKLRRDGCPMPPVHHLSGPDTLDDNDASSPSSAFDMRMISPSKMLDPSVKEVVTMDGVWDGKTWSGMWFQSKVPDLKAPFEYEPVLEDVIDEGMQDLPCSICDGADPQGFLFCDLCNGDEEDWHCPTCLKVLARYGNSLPPSRHWKGFFRMYKGAGKFGAQQKERFRLNFKYLMNHTEQVAELFGDGFNNFGKFKIIGKLFRDEDSKVYEMKCHKAYVLGPIPKKKKKRAARRGSKYSVQGQAMPSEALTSSGGISRSNAGGAAAAVESKSKAQSTSVAGNGALKRQVAELTKRLQQLQDLSKVLMITDMDCYFHFAERPQDVTSLTRLWELMSGPFPNSERVKWISEPPRAPLDIIFKTHEASYICKLLNRATKNDDDHLDLTASMKAAGAACLAVEKVVKGQVDAPRSSSGSVRVNTAVSLTRPPGHRTGRSGVPRARTDYDKRLAFALLNMAAAATIHAHHTFHERVALVDISVLAGTGSLEILSHYHSSIADSSTRSDELYFASVHLADSVAERTERGEPFSAFEQHQSAVINLETESLPIASNKWRKAFRAVLSALTRFAPSLIVVSAGFDGSIADSENGEARTELTPADYAWMASRLIEICPRMVTVLEGGNDADYVDAGFRAFLSSLLTP
ncbi:Type-2 histone deacetylase 2 (DdHdaC), partial [Durusdinium trenchii]